MMEKKKKPFQGYRQNSWIPLAGDSHIGAVIAGLQCGKTIEEAIATANRVSAKVVETEGALLSDEAFASLDLL